MRPLAIFLSASPDDDVYSRAFAHILQTAKADVWMNEYKLEMGLYNHAITQQLQTRPIFIVLLSPHACASTTIRDVCLWAANRYQRNYEGVIVSVTAAYVGADLLQDWPFLEGFKPIEGADGQPLAPEAAAQRVMQALDFTQRGDALVVMPRSSSVVDPFLIQGRSLQAQGRHAEALRVFQRATVQFPNAVAAWVNYGDALRYIERHREATAAYDHALAINRDDSTVWKRRGTVVFVRGLYGLAMAAYDHAIALDANDAVAWQGRGDALFALQQYEAALAAYEQALTLTPTNIAVWKRCGETLYRLQRYAELLIMSERALAQSPNHVAWEMRGWALFGLSRYEELLASCDCALAHDDYDVDAWQHRARALIALGRTDEAREAELRANFLLSK